MNDKVTHDENEGLLPGLLKIQQVLKHTPPKESVFQNKKKKLVDACKQLAAKLGIVLDIPSLHVDDDVDVIMDHIALHSTIRIQKINLEPDWWKRDLGMLLAFLNGEPCVLVPKKNGGYQRLELTDTVTLSKEDLAKVDAVAYVFIKPLPDNANRLWDIFKFSFSSLRLELRSTILLQLALSLLMMSLPIFMSYFFNHFQAVVATNQLSILTIILLVNSIIYFFLSTNHSLMMLNLRFKVQRSLEPALWDRLLKLSPQFFRQFNAGDIAYRAGVVSAIQEMLTQTAIFSLFGVVLAIVSFGLMCYYDFVLAIFALIVFLSIGAIVYLLCRRFLIFQRQIFDNLTKQSGFVFQVISGIIKFKVSASEFRAFNLWADYFSNLLIARFKAEKVQAGIRIIHDSLLMVVTLLLFCLYFSQKSQQGIGNFIAFNAAFAQFFSALINIITFASSLVVIIPLFEQSLVIFRTKVPPIPKGGSYIELQGKIEIKNLSFRYHDDQPLIYKNLNLCINPGEVVGITGNSGCGKSTLFRILLGLESPLEGQILYDNINMEMINLSMLRQQVGLVTQKSVLVPGTILENIIGHDKSLTRNDAWDIVYKLGLEYMITSLPMEMDTFINEGMQSLSGGELQRIVLARALVKKPKILFLDEATSALDNKSQSTIQDYLAKLNITQIIIAHRLSTLREATRVLVIKDGEIAQNGPFEQLLKEPGYFAELAQLQMVPPIHSS